MKITSSSFVFIFFLFISAPSLTACAPISVSKDFNDSEKNRKIVSESLVEKGVPPEQADQASREFQVKESNQKVGFQSELRHQECNGESSTDKKSAGPPECKLNYLNRLTLNLVCPLTDSGIFRGGIQQGRPARFKKVRWLVDGKSGEVETDSEGRFSFMYFITRTAPGHPPMDPSPPREVRLSIQGIDLIAHLDRPEDTTVSAPDAVCLESR